MTRRNLTIQLDDDVVRRAKVVAARRGMSVSGLMAQQLTEMVDGDERYEAAKQYVLESIRTARNRGSGRWTRDELHDRPVLRRE